MAINVRLGFATNSSSSHSLILLPPGTYTEKKGDDTYSWDHFVLSQPEDKLSYLSLIWRASIPHDMDPEQRIALEEQIFGPHAASNHGYIDHQSIFYLPRPYGTSAKGEALPDTEFMEALKQYFLDPSLNILGGNDNEEDDRGGFNLPLPTYGRRGLVCRNDGTHWVVFNRETGIKFRFTLAPGELVKEGELGLSSPTPELVDLKISDNCPFDCEFCYQNSRSDGAFARIEDVETILDELARLKTFEVAIGGGEPTMHPEFGAFLWEAERRGITPNFSTRNLAFLDDKRLVQIVRDTCGGFAYSARTPAEIEEYAKKLDANGFDGRSYFNSAAPAPSVQIVLVPGKEEELAAMLAATNKHRLSVTLLAFKAVGRGAKYRTPRSKLDVGAIVTILGSAQQRVGVDTPLLSILGSQALDDMGVWRGLYEFDEGMRSCYIDAVTRTMGPFSYCHPEQMVKLQDLRADTIKATFNGFSVGRSVTAL